ncbi:hypothetical protein EE612_011230, partial [Oryza sativa]
MCVHALFLFRVCPAENLAPDYPSTEAPDTSTRHAVMRHAAAAAVPLATTVAMLYARLAASPDRPWPPPPRRAPPGDGTPPRPPSRPPVLQLPRLLRLRLRLARRVQAPPPRLRPRPAPPGAPPSPVRLHCRAPRQARRRRRGSSRRVGVEATASCTCSYVQVRRLVRHQGRRHGGHRPRPPRQGGDAPLRGVLPQRRLHVLLPRRRPAGPRRGGRGAGHGDGAAVRPAVPVGLAAGLLGPAVEPRGVGGAPRRRLRPRQGALRRPGGRRARRVPRVGADARGGDTLPDLPGSHGARHGVLRAPRRVRLRRAVVVRAPAQARGEAAAASRGGRAARTGFRRRHGVLAVLPGDLRRRDGRPVPRGDCRVCKRPRPWRKLDRGKL